MANKKRGSDSLGPDLTSRETIRNYCAQPDRAQFTAWIIAEVTGTNIETVRRELLRLEAAGSIERTGRVQKQVVYRSAYGRDQISADDISAAKLAARYGVSEAARQLGVSRQTVYERRKRYNKWRFCD